MYHFFLNFVSKKNKMFEYIFFFCFLFLFLIFIFMDYVQYIRSDRLGSKLINRTLIVSNRYYYDHSVKPEEDLSFFSSLPHVESTYSYYMPNYLEILPDLSVYIRYQDLQNFVMCYGTKEISDGEMILPSNILPNLGYKGEEIIGTNFDFSYQGKIYSLKVAGVYESNESEFSIYITERDMKEHFLLDLTENMYIIVLDHYDSTDEVIAFLQQHSYDANISDSSGLSDISICDFFLTLFRILFYFICSMVILFGFFIIKNILYEQRRDIAILKAVGYYNLHIFMLLFCFILKTFLIAYIGALFSFSIVFGIFCMYIGDLSLYTQSHFYSILLYDSFIFFLMLVLSFFTMIVSYPKLSKLSPIMLFQDF